MLCYNYGTMLQIHNLSKAFPGHTLFDHCSLFLDQGERVALIGPNGSGKTTLFRMIVGDEPVDAGDISTRKGHRIGFLHQEMDPIKGNTVLNEVLQFSDELNALRRKVAKTADQLAHPASRNDTELLREYDKAHARFEELGGYELEHRAEKVLAGLGFKQSDFSRPTDEFSGGWVMRIELSKLLLGSPEVMLLDEPTNHLDLASVLWLRSYLTSYRGSLIFTSHDRLFINQVSTRIVELDNGSLVKYNGDYAYYLQEKEKRKELLLAGKKNQDKEIAHMNRFIERFRYKASLASRVQSMIKARDKIKRIEIPPDPKTLHFSFPQPSRSGKEVMVLEDIHKSYEHNHVYRGVNLTVLQGDKIALVGANGAGKSTLLKIMAGTLDFEQGRRTLGHKVTPGYSPQHRTELLNTASTCLEEIQGTGKGLSTSVARKLLGRFLFTGDDVDKQVSVLSGGEKSRLILVKILCDPPNLLMMDEPINHLDISSRAILIQALQEFTATMCFISHDEYFISQVANKIIEVGDGKLITYHGDYEYYLYKQEQDEAPGPKTRRGVKLATPKAARMQARDEKKQKERDAKKQERALGRKIAKAEKELKKVGARMKELEQALAAPDAAAKSDFVQLKREYKELALKKETFTQQRQEGLRELEVK